MYGSRPPLQRTTWRRSNDPGTSRRLSGVFFFSWLLGIFCQGWMTYAVATFRWKNADFFFETIKLPLKIGHPKTKVVFQPSIFQGLIMLNFGGVELSSSWFVCPWLFSTFCWGLGDPKGISQIIRTTKSTHRTPQLGVDWALICGVCLSSKQTVRSRTKEMWVHWNCFVLRTSSKSISKKHQKNL